MSSQEKKWLGPVSVSELLGPIDDNEIMGSSPIHVLARENADGKTYTAVIDKLIAQTELLALLLEASPSESGMSSAGIHADWIMPDKTDGNKENLRLLILHEKGLGKAWKLFERYRHLFINVLHAEREGSFFGLQGKEIGFRTEEDFGPSFVQEAKGVARKEDVINILKSLHKYRRNDLDTLLRPFIKKGSDGTDFQQWSRARLKQFFKLVKNSRNPDFSNDIENAYRSHRYQEFPHPVSQQTMYIDTRFHEADVVAKALSKETVFDRGCEATLELIPHGNYKLKTVVHLCKYARERTMYVMLQWHKTDSGKRHWLYEPLSGPRLEAARSTLNNENVEADHLNALAGLLALATIGGKNIVNSWPKKMNLPHGRASQIMSSAQAPILAIIQEDDLMTGSPLLPALEKFVDSKNNATLD